MKILLLILILFTTHLIFSQSNISVSGSAVITSNNADICADSRTGTDGVNFILSNGGSWCNGALPVELTLFTAQTNDDNVLLNWQTATEVNNSGFEILRRWLPLEDGQSEPDLSDEKFWRIIGFVGGSGNSSSPNDYSFTDKSISGGGKFAYRLKQIDIDGTYSYSEEVEVTIVPSKFELSQNYPNPFNPTTVIRFQLPVASNVHLKIYDILGNEVSTLVNEQKDAGYYEVEWVAKGFSSGVYFYILRVDEKFISVRKMMLLQ